MFAHKRWWVVLAVVLIACPQALAQRGGGGGRGGGGFGGGGFGGGRSFGSGGGGGRSFSGPTRGSGVDRSGVVGGGARGGRGGSIDSGGGSGQRDVGGKSSGNRSVRERGIQNSWKAGKGEGVSERQRSGIAGVESGRKGALRHPGGENQLEGNLGRHGGNKNGCGGWKNWGWGSWYGPYWYDPWYFWGPYGFGLGYYYVDYDGPRDRGSRGDAQDEENDGNVELRIEPRDVMVYVDEVLTARSGRTTILLPTGPWTLRFVKDGYRTMTLELDVQQGVSYRIERRLEKLGEGESGGP